MTERTMILLKFFLLANLATATSLPSTDRRVSRPQNWLSRRSPAPPKELPKKIPEGAPVVWETSRDHGWIGGRKNPNREGSPKGSVPRQEPVTVRARGTGPASLDVLQGKVGKRLEYEFEPGKKFDKKFKHPERLRVDAVGYRPQHPEEPSGSLELSGTGRKSFSRIRGKGLGPLDAVEAYGPGPRIVQGKRKAWELSEDARTFTHPPKRTDYPNPVDGTPGKKIEESESTKRSAKSGQVTTTAWLQDEHDKRGWITTRVTNSPDHSPPPSPRRPSRNPNSDQKWPPSLG